MASMKLKLEPQGWHFLQLSVFLIALLLFLQSDGVRGEVEASHGSEHNDWKIVAVVEKRSDAQEPWHVWVGHFFGKHWGIDHGERGCEESYGIFPCSITWGGNVALMVAFGYMLLDSGTLMSEAVIC